MTLTDKIAIRLSLFPIVAAMIVEPALLGGAYIAGKSGTPPTGPYWDNIAGLGMGIISIVCQTLTLSIAISSQSMGEKTRGLLIGCFMLTLMSFLAVMPVYFQASEMKCSIPDAIEWYLPSDQVMTSDDGRKSQTVTLLTFLYHWLIVIATQISPPMLLIAIVSLEKENDGNGGDAVKRVRRSAEDRETTVIAAIQPYGEMGASMSMISGDVEMPHSTCRKVVVELTAAGKLEECQLSGKTKMYRVVKE